MTVRQDHAREDSWASGSLAPSPPTAKAPTAGNGRYRASVDHHDFTAVYEGCYADVARWVRALGGPPADLADIVQEVFVVVHRRLPDFDGDNLIAWLYRITAHQVRDFRRLIWIKHIFRRSVQVSSEVASINPTQLMVLETREKQRHLEKLLSKLSESLCSTFVLFEIEGYTAEEIAVIQDLSINTVRARIQRARKKLTELLATERAKGGPGLWSR
jgi:RNA polymerase sigma-70 factor (ECF subfamily)